MSALVDFSTSASEKLVADGFVHQKPGFPCASSGCVTASLVSHQQSGDVALLLDDLIRLQPAALKHLIIVNNLPDRVPAGLDRAPFKITVIQNAKARGLPANHNQALKLC